jgi:THO complex subunit 2
VDVLSAVKSSLPVDVWQSIDPSLFSVFWALSLYDIYIPKLKYESTKNALQNTVQNIDSTLRSTDPTSKTARDLRREQRSKRNANEDLVSEQKVQVANVKAIRGWLQEHAGSFLKGCERLDKTPQCFLQHCILPRALFAPEDAFFCAKFAATMNEMAVPYWSSLNYYDKMHRCLPAVVYCITEREAANLGIFFQETLKQLDHWNNADTYARECASKPGFSISIKSESSIKATFEQYSKIFNKWHNKVSVAAHELLCVFRQFSQKSPLLFPPNVTSRSLFKRIYF